MSASLTAFVNHQHAIVIDTNIRRVVGRVFLGIAYPSLDDDSRISKLLEKITPRKVDPAILPQAFMDLGSLICTARNPKCGVCPLRQECRSSRRFLSSTPPKPPRRRVTERIHGEKKYPDRIYRGKILAAVREQRHVMINEGLGKKIDTTFDAIADAGWLREMCTRLERDGLVKITNKRLKLPK